MGNKLEDQKILDATIMNIEAEHRGQVKQKVLTSSHGGKGLFNVCNLIEYQISYAFQTCEILYLKYLTYFVFMRYGMGHISSTV